MPSNGNSLLTNSGFEVIELSVLTIDIKSLRANTSKNSNLPKIEPSLNQANYYALISLSIYFPLVGLLSVIIFGAIGNCREPDSRLPLPHFQHFIYFIFPVFIYFPPGYGISGHQLDSHMPATCNGKERYVQVFE